MPAFLICHMHKLLHNQCMNRDKPQKDARTHAAALTQLGVGPQDVGDVLGAELAHAVLTGLGHRIYEGAWVIS